jgi:hypothetical protein
MKPREKALVTLNNKTTCSKGSRTKDRGSKAFNPRCYRTCFTALIRRISIFSGGCKTVKHRDFLSSRNVDSGTASPIHNRENALNTKKVLDLSFRSQKLVM